MKGASGDRAVSRGKLRQVLCQVVRSLPPPIPLPLGPPRSWVPCVLCLEAAGALRGSPVGVCSSECGYGYAVFGNCLLVTCVFLLFGVVAPQSGTSQASETGNM